MKSLHSDAVAVDPDLEAEEGQSAPNGRELCVKGRHGCRSTFFGNVPKTFVFGTGDTGTSREQQIARPTAGAAVVPVALRVHSESRDRRPIR
jgi:hypothetical protein